MRLVTAGGEIIDGLIVESLITLRSITQKSNYSGYIISGSLNDGIISKKWGKTVTHKH